MPLPSPDALRHSIISWIGIITLVMATSGCSAAYESSVTPETIGTIGRATGAAGDMVATTQMADQAWLDRIELVSLQRALSLYQTATTQASPSLDAAQRQTQLVHLYQRMARGHLLMATDHLRLANEKDASIEASERAMKAAEYAVAISSPEFARKLAEDDKAWRRDLALIEGNEGALSLYWYATSLYEWAESHGLMTLSAYGPTLHAIIERLIELRPEIMYGGPYRLLGRYHTRLPVGSRNLRTAREAFERSLIVAPNFFDNRLWYAEYYAVQAQDRSAFDNQIEMMRSTPAMILPEIEPENLLAQRRAEQLADQRDDLFY